MGSQSQRSTHQNYRQRRSNSRCIKKKEMIKCIIFQLCQNLYDSLTDIINEMSHCKEIQNAYEICEQYSKSSSKRLFDSVFKIIDHDQLQVSSFQQSDTNGSRITSILQNQSFAQALLEKLKQDQLINLYPILKIQCKNKKGALVSLEINDLVSVFQRFGTIYTIHQSSTQLVYYACYTCYSSAFVAMKLLNNFSLRHSPAELCVEWCPGENYGQISHLIPDYHTQIQWISQNDSLPKQQYNSNNLLKQCKLTCRYDIQIQNQKDFQVARRIIGSKGTNMKKIIQTALQQMGFKNSPNSNQILKLRLRGRGSGYKEGPDQIQSEQQLHLCISAKDELIYNYACTSVQKLLQNVYSEYQEFTKKQGRCQNLMIKKIDMSSQSNSNLNNQNGLKNVQINNNVGRMQAAKIEHYLEMRNKARRQLNFAEADRIRNYLRTCGVCLIDQKGRRGKATEVTTWKYLL